MKRLYIFCSGVTYHFLICVLSYIPLASAQEIGTWQENPGASYHNVKLNTYPLIPNIFAINKRYIPLELQYEKAFGGNPKFTGTMAALSEIYLPGFSLSSFTFRTGPRFYIRHSQEPYNGFFIGLSPMYNWQNIGVRKQHSLALDAMAGYQKIIKRISLEANMSVGYGGGWYHYYDSPPYMDSQGFHEQVFINTQST